MWSIIGALAVGFLLGFLAAALFVVASREPEGY
jgi:NhaP-type Na+/H+ or K+/H+ antiporter